jgi:hypothetical protein
VRQFSGRGYTFGCFFPLSVPPSSPCFVALCSRALHSLAQSLLNRNPLARSSHFAQTTDCVNDAERLPPQKELPGERGAIELPCGDPHTTIASPGGQGGRS